MNEIIQNPIFYSLLIISSMVPILIYGIYIIAILFNKPEKFDMELEEYVPISIMIRAHNEEQIIENKIKNIAKSDYPSNLIQVIIVDDASEDKTIECAKKALKEYNLGYKIIENKKRLGANESFNIGIEKCDNETIITSDADVVFEKDAIYKLVAVLTRYKEIGAACGELNPKSFSYAISTGSEIGYRSVFGKISQWESRLHSICVFNAQFSALKKSAYSRINPHRGSTDTNYVLGVIRRGYRAIYVPQAKFYEYITPSLINQMKQKIRRAARIDQAFLDNLNMNSPKYGNFGKIVFPLRMLIHIVVPVLFTLAIIFWMILLSYLNILYGIIFITINLAAIITSRLYPNIISSFYWHQIYLLLGIIYSFKKFDRWESIERKEM